MATTYPADTSPAERRHRALELAAGLPAASVVRDKVLRPRNAERLALRDPATGETVHEYSCASPEDVDMAVRTARETFVSGIWSGQPASQRAKVLWNVADLIEGAATKLALLEVLDNGKPIVDAMRIDIPQTAAHFRYQAAAALRLEGAVIPPSGSNALTLSLREPVGVIAAITPWNFPLIMVARVLAPALAAGNSVVVKPSEETSATALVLAELLAKAGLPSGALNVLLGTGELTGRALVSHDEVDQIAFTGGHDAAREIILGSAHSFKRLTLELGGKSPAIVFPDVDLSRAVPELLVGAFSNQGQNCCAITRVLAHREIVSELTDAISSGARALRVGSGFDDLTNLGPLINFEHRARVQSVVADACEAGARLVSGADVPDGELSVGAFLTPAVLDQVPMDCAFAQQEVFGPAILIHSFDTVSEAISLANATRYGLAAGVWTQQLDLAQEVARRLAVGTVWVNCYERFDAAVPLSGRGESGYGNGVGGHLAIEEFTAPKTVWFAEPRVASDGGRA